MRVPQYLQIKTETTGRGDNRLTDVTSTDLNKAAREQYVVECLQRAETNWEAGKNISISTQESETSPFADNASLPTSDNIKSLDQKLDELSTAFEAGLISQEEYSKMRQAVMDSF